jgi:hypothetical protein
MKAVYNSARASSRLSFCVLGEEDAINAGIAERLRILERLPDETID